MNKALYKKEWYEKNKEKEKASVRKYYKANAEDINAKRKPLRSEPKTRFIKGKSHAKIKYKKEWTLSLEEYCSLISKNCNYCDGDISKETGSGLDRLDNNKGYTLDNVVPCCKVCNGARNAYFTPEEWKVGIKAILDFRKLKE